MSQQDSPNALVLEPEKAVEATRMSKWPLYVGILILFILFGVLIYSVNFAHNPEEEMLGAKKVVIREDERPVLMGEGSGLNLAVPKNTAVIPSPTSPKTVKQEPIVVVRDNTPKIDQEAENRKRLRQQAYLSALSAPLMAKKVSSKEQVQTIQKPIQAKTLSGAKTTNVSQEYNPAADMDKENFLNSRGKADNAWILENERVAGNVLEIKTGAVIPGIMITGINSDLPGQIIAQVSQNVFDSNTGRYLLIPQGAKLFGVYDSRVIYGQSRVLVAWNRIIYPDSSSISIGAMSGTDMSGYGGYKDEVDNHYFRIFGSAILMSLIVGGTAYAMDTATGGDTGEYSLQSQMTASMAQQLGQTTTRLLEKNLSIKPTLEIRPGYQFNIVVSKDIVFRQPYQSVEKAHLLRQR